jgi:hypothetical protein
MFGSLVFLSGALWLLIKPQNGFSIPAYHLCVGSLCMLAAAGVRCCQNPLALLKIVVCAVIAYAVISIAVTYCKELS